MGDKSYVYFFGGEGRKYSVYISAEDGSCVKCPAPARRNSTLMLVAALVVVLLAGFLNSVFQNPLHDHPRIVLLMILCALIAGLVTLFIARKAKEKDIVQNGQPVLKNEISKAHIAAAMRQIATDQHLVLGLAAASVICLLAFWFTCNVFLWLCGTASLIVLAGLAGPMQLKGRKEMYQWLAVYESHTEWASMLRFSKGYLTMSKNGRYYPDNNIQAVSADGTILWDIGTIQSDPVSQGYQILEKIENDLFRVQSVSEDEYLLNASVPSLEQKETENN